MLFAFSRESIFLMAHRKANGGEGGQIRTDMQKLKPAPQMTASIYVRNKESRKTHTESMTLGHAARLACGINGGIRLQAMMNHIV